MLQLLCTGQRQCSMLHRSVLPAVEPRCTTAWTAHGVDGQHHGSVDSHVWRDSDSSHDPTRTGYSRSSVDPMRVEDMLPPALIDAKNEWSSKVFFHYLSRAMKAPRKLTNFLHAPAAGACRFRIGFCAASGIREK